MNMFSRIWIYVILRNDEDFVILSRLGTTESGARTGSHAQPKTTMGQ